MQRLLLDEVDAATDLARHAGRAVMSLYGMVAAEEKEGGSPVTLADRLANRIIVAGLRARFPDDGVLSEESRDDSGRLQCERVWVIDPLDGTREFIGGVAEFSVMIGLAVGGHAVLGVVYNPAVETLYAGVIGDGAWVQRGTRQWQRLTATPAPAGRLRMVGSRSHADARVTRIGERLGVSEVRPSGSVGVKCALVAEGECEVYVHPVPYLKEWDTCAPEAVLRAAGGSVTDCSGEQLRYNKRNPVQPRGILAVRPGLQPMVLSAMRSIFPGLEDEVRGAGNDAWAEAAHAI